MTFAEGRRVLCVVGALGALVVTGCGHYEGPAGAAPVADGGGGDAGSGSIEIDGSSTVAPLTDAIAEEYARDTAGVTANVGVSGTGGGFERFCAGETDISDASRVIEDDEAAACAKNGIEYIELRIGTDALTMVTSPQTEFVDCLTTEEVTTIFGADHTATTWQDVNPAFPAEPIHVFGPGQDSGTYDFMVEDVLSLEESQQQYNASEDDNIIAQGVIGTPNSWGFFGYAYYQESADSLKVIAYDGGGGCVAPSVQTAQDGSYGMTRPLLIYVRTESLRKPHVAAFVTYYLDTVNDIISEVGYIPEPDDDLARAKATLQEVLGS
jgi:phosphate transport system substrate-binding protein